MCYIKFIYVQSGTEINLKGLNEWESNGNSFWYIRKSLMIWNISSIWVVCYQIMHDINAKLNPGLLRPKQWSKRTTLHQQIFAEETLMCYYLMHAPRIIYCYYFNQPIHRHITTISFYIMYTPACFNVYLSLSGNFIFVPQYVK
jgi:hypothetical protein